MNVYNKLSDCEKQEISKVSTNVYYLFTGSLCFFGLNYAVLIVFFIIIVKPIKNSWKHLLKNINRSYSTLKARVINRLSLCHHDFALEENEETAKLQKKMNHRHFERLIAHVSILIVISFILYFVSVYAFSNSIFTYLTFRIDLLNTLANRRVNLYQLSYFAMSSLKHDLGLQENANNITIFNDPVLSALDLYDHMSIYKKLLISKYYQKNIPLDIWTLEFDYNKNQNSLLIFGAYSAYELLVEDALSLIEQGSFLKMTTVDKDSLAFLNDIDLNEYYNNLNYFSNVSFSLSSQAIQSSEDSIIKEFYTLIYFIVGALSFLIILLCAYVIPFFSSEQQTLKKLNSILDIIPAK